MGGRSIQYGWCAFSMAGSFVSRQLWAEQLNNSPSFRGTQLQEVWLSSMTWRTWESLHWMAVLRLLHRFRGSMKEQTLKLGQGEKWELPTTFLMDRKAPTMVWHSSLKHKLILYCCFLLKSQIDRRWWIKVSIAFNFHSLGCKLVMLWFPVWAKLVLNSGFLNGPVFGFLGD